MSDQPSIPPTHGVSEYIEDGARIAAILLVWGIIAGFFAFGVTAIGVPGGMFQAIGPQVGALFALTGVLNAVLFVLYRAIDYWKQYG